MPRSRNILRCKPQKTGFNVIRLAFFLCFCLLALSTSAQDPGAAWDVDKPVGPTSEVSFLTTEGTWISLDVTPDGKTIVFDLLGDIYIIPFEGGTATPLTSGAAWDVQGGGRRKVPPPRNGAGR